MLSRKLFLVFAHRGEGLLDILGIITSKPQGLFNKNPVCEMSLKKVLASIGSKSYM